ncbi:unnamed protein product, partial [Dicrocoelium dendriticum]
TDSDFLGRSATHFRRLLYQTPDLVSKKVNCRTDCRGLNETNEILPNIAWMFLMYTFEMVTLEFSVTKVGVNAYAL